MARSRITSECASPLCSAAAPTLNISCGSPSDLGRRRRTGGSGCRSSTRGTGPRAARRCTGTPARVQDPVDGVLAGDGADVAEQPAGRGAGGLPGLVRRSGGHRGHPLQRGRRGRTGGPPCGGRPGGGRRPCVVHDWSNRQNRPSNLSRLTPSGGPGVASAPGHPRRPRRGATPCGAASPQEYDSEPYTPGGYQIRRGGPHGSRVMGTHRNSMTALRSRPPGRMPAQATLHCLTGCAIGEVLGMVIGTSAGLHDGATVALADRAGLLLRLRADRPRRPARRPAVPPGRAGGPGRGHRLDPRHGDRRQRGHARRPGRHGGRDRRACCSGARWPASLAVAFVVTLPVNRALMSRGRGHAVVHACTDRPGPRTADDPGLQQEVGVVRCGAARGGGGGSADRGGRCWRASGARRASPGCSCARGPGRAPAGYARPDDAAASWTSRCSSVVPFIEVVSPTPLVMQAYTTLFRRIPGRTEAGPCFSHPTG